MRVFLGVIAAIAVVFCTRFIFWGPQIVHAWAIGLTGGAALLIFLFGLILALAAAILFEGWVRGAAITVGVVVLALAITTGVRFNYDVNSVYMAEAEETTSASPNLAQRAPFKVADQSSTRNLGDTTGEAKNVKILPDEGDHGLWTALVVRRGFMAGYEAVQSNDVPLFGSASAKSTSTCDFAIDAAEQRMGGLFPHESMDYLALGATPPNVTFDQNDAYAYCDGETPIVVLPLKQLSGFWIPTWSNYGAATYDGTTGELTVHTDTSKIPGPVYPASLAVAQRSALTADGSFSDYFFNRSGFESTAGDQGDPNSGNESEFGMRLADKSDSVYVSPLTPRGSSTSVTAIGITDATGSKAGVRNTLTVHKYPKDEARAANSSIAHSIKNQYSWMPDWASGLEIFEIAPGEDGSWVASIGQTQAVTYRAVISADGKAVLYDENGGEVTRTGVTRNPSTAGKPSTAVTGSVQDMTVVELRDLANSVLDELASRTTAK